MKKLVLVFLLLGISPSFALHYIAYCSVDTACTDGLSSLVGDHSTNPYDYAILLGYVAPGDGGGGILTRSGMTCTPNQGTIFQNLGNCFYRQSSNYGPKEFGAHADGMDTVGLLNAWLTANQPHVGDVGTYSVASPLSCATTMTELVPSIQGPGGTTPTSQFSIQALSGFSGDAVIDAGDYCHLSGITVDANNVMSVNGVEVTGTHVGIDGRSLIENGDENVFCQGTTPIDGLQIKDSQIINAYDDGIEMEGNCSNVRLVGDFISRSANPLGTGTPSGLGVSFTGNELTLANSTIVGSGGAGLDLQTAEQVSIIGNNFDDDGSTINGSPGNGSPALRIGGSSHVSSCGNHVFRSTGTAQVLFAGSTDDIEFCGNVYTPGSSASEATFRPSYVYDARGSPVLTNTHLYEQPTPQAAGYVYSQPPPQLGQQIVGPLQVPQFTNEITGYTLSVSPLVYPIMLVGIAAGTAADSTGTALIQNPACSVNFGTTGAGGLDTGIFAHGTYNVFAIASAGGANGGTPATSCVASTLLAPNLSDPSLTAYQLSTTAQAIGTALTLYNVQSVAGVKPGDIVGASFLSGIPKVSTVATSTFYSSATQVTGGSCMTGPPYNCFQISALVAPNLVTNMAVSDNLNNTVPTCAASAMNDLTNSAYIIALNPSGSNTIKLSTAIGASSDCFTISGGNTITLTGGSSTGAPSPTAITIDTGLYRMLGAVITTTTGTLSIVPFTQHGDTFYLTTPVHDISSPLATGANYFPLSVPSGLIVEAMGRCAGGGNPSANPVLLYTPTTSPATPGSFTSTPGYAVQTLPNTQSFPYLLHTNISQQIVAAPNAMGAQLDCMTDGWVWKRAQ